MERGEIDNESTYLKDLNDCINDEMYERKRLDSLDMMESMMESYIQAGGNWDEYNYIAE